MSLSKIILKGSVADLAEALKHVKDLSYLDEYGYTPLIESVIIDDEQKAKLIVTAGVDVNQKDVTGRTALHWAVANNNYNIAALLLENGAQVNTYSLSSESVLVKPILRQQENFKRLLIQYGGSLQFAQDYIHVKLLGHRYELLGSVDIVDPQGIFTEVDYEGFYFDSSLSLIRSSLWYFRYHYLAKNLRLVFPGLEKIIESLDNASQLLYYDNYLLDYQRHQSDILYRLHADPLILPFGQEGHAFAVVKAGALLGIIDRAKHEDNENAIPVYYINRLARWKAAELIPMLYERQSIAAIKDCFQEELRLQEIARIPMPAQRIGNCSWANTEAIIPTLYVLLQLLQKERSVLPDILADAEDLFYRWRQWDRERALHFFMQEFQGDDPARRASIAALLAGVVFQTCSVDSEEDVERAKKIIHLLKKHHYDYVFNSYMKFYVHERSTQAGKNLQRLLEIYERDR